LRGIPIIEESFVPKKTFKASYASDFDKEQYDRRKSHHEVYSALCEFSATLPVVNLASYAQISQVQCASDRIVIHFGSVAALQEAQDAWQKTILASDFAVMIGQQWKCNGEEKVALRRVKSIDILSSLSLTLSSEELKQEEVIRDYDIQVEQYEVPTHALQKRSFWNWSKNKGYGFAIDLNYDSTTNRAIERNISVYKSNEKNIRCVDCYAVGEAQLSFRVSGRAFRITTYEVKLSAQLKAAIELNLELNKVGENDLTEIPLWKLPLGPLLVPGIFSFDPEFRLSLGVYYLNEKEANLQFGGNFSIPVSWVITSNNGLFSRPNITKTFDPQIYVHPLNRTDDMYWKLNGRITPQFGFSLSLFSIRALDMSVGTEHSLGIQVTTREDKSHCDNSIVNLRLYHQHLLWFTFGRNDPKRVNLFNSAEVPLPCPENICDLCINNAGIFVANKSSVLMGNNTRNVIALLPSSLPSLNETTTEIPKPNIADLSRENSESGNLETKASSDLERINEKSTMKNLELKNSEKSASPDLSQADGASTVANSKEKSDSNAGSEISAHEKTKGSDDASQATNSV
jgi:hypothetical protein